MFMILFPPRKFPGGMMGDVDRGGCGTVSFCRWP